MRHLWIMGFVLSLAACETSYKEAIDIVQLNERSYQIDATGNGYTEQKRIGEYALLKASQLCQQLEFKAFLILADKDTSTMKLYEGTSSTHHNNELVVMYLAKTEPIPPHAYNCELIYNQLSGYITPKKE